MTITTSLWDLYIYSHSHFISKGTEAQQEYLTCPRSNTYKVVKPGLGSKCYCFSFCPQNNMAHTNTNLGPASQFQYKTNKFTSGCLYSSLHFCPQILIQMPYPGSHTLLNPLKVSTLLSAFLSPLKTRSNSRNVLRTQIPHAAWYVSTSYQTIRSYKWPTVHSLGIWNRSS